ncbi:hypothetical protein N7501_005017 [Penicillium viridicatum]|nr:hypothetical protein N7501_005017 [Penicillium viridicatum]
MHEPIYGCYRHGLAPEPLTPENSENCDVVTVSAQSALGPLGTLSLFRARAIYRKDKLYSPCNNSSLQVNNKARGQCHAFHCWLHSGVRSLDKGGAKSYSSALLGNGRG